MSAPAFRAGHAAGNGWRDVAGALAKQLGSGDANAPGLGFLYLTEELAGDAAAVLTFLRERTGVIDWVGAVGFGVAAQRTEYFNEPAGAALVAPFPSSRYRMLHSIVTDRPGQAADAARAFSGGATAPLAIVHGDATNATIPEIVAGLADESGAFLAGGLTALASRAQIADEVTGGGLSGVMLAPGVGAVTGLSQGCTPIGPSHVITDGRANVLVELDRRPSLDVFVEDIGRDLALELERAGRMVHVALSVPGSDRGDYLVRNLTGIDPDRGLIAIGDTIDTGQALTFCMRNRDTATADIRRMASDMAARLGGPPSAGLYFSCVARGPNLFGPKSREMTLIADALGDFPVAGFYANGEIFNHRLYGYTGVLVLFP
jgi:small ligand-binding sensory domain FIST